MDIDAQLLARFVHKRDADAFAQLTRRHGAMVFAVAKRITLNHHDAEEVAQGCFLELARKAESIDGSLAGWLHKAAAYRAIDTIRAADRRRRHEQAAAKHEGAQPDGGWSRIAPVIDAALAELPDELRLPVVLYYLEGRNQKEVAAQLSVHDSTVSRRLETAMAALRRKLEAGGVTGSCAALPALLAQHAMVAAPKTLALALGKLAVAAGAGAVTGVRATSGAAAGSGSGLASSGGAATTGAQSISAGTSLATKGAVTVTAKLVAAAVLTAGVLTAGVTLLHKIHGSPPPNGSFAFPTPAPDADSSGPAATDTTPPDQGPVLHLVVVDQSSRAPLAGAKVELLHRERRQNTYTTGPDGSLNLSLGGADSFPLTLLISDKHYVGRRLSWGSPDEDIPKEYIVNMEPGQQIAGRVLDDDGKPVAGAHVMISAWSPMLNAHDRTWIFDMEAATTDTDGRWTFDQAPHDSKTVSIGAWDLHYVNDIHGEWFCDTWPYAPDATITLHRGISVNGLVLGSDGQPVAGAEVHPGGGYPGNVGALPDFKTGTDGRFAFVCKPGTQVKFTVQSQDYAPEAAQAMAQAGQPDVVIHLNAGQRLEGQVIDTAGKPVANANIYLDKWRGDEVLRSNPPLRSDQDGRFHWDHAPDDALVATIMDAHQQFMIKAAVPLQAGSPNIVTLARALDIHGRVLDAVTGKPIPAFDVFQAIGRGDEPPDLDSPRLNRRMKHKGMFEITLGLPHSSCAVRIVANGYQPADSRVIQSDEGDVQLEIKLQPLTR